MGVIKTGVALKEETYNKLISLMESLSIRNKSKIISDAIESYVAEKSVLMEEGYMGGIITILYDHHTKDIEHNLTHIQHHHREIIISNMHAHLDDRNCLEAILIKGDVRRIKALISELGNIKGLTALRHAFFRIMEE
jgi:CopG family nickel-responsive transcriptional regulator